MSKKNTTSETFETKYSHHKESGLKEGETRFSFIGNKVNIEKVKAISAYHKTPIKEIMNYIISNYVEVYIKENGLDQFDKVSETYLNTPRDPLFKK